MREKRTWGVLALVIIVLMAVVGYCYRPVTPAASSSAKTPGQPVSASRAGAPPGTGPSALPQAQAGPARAHEALLAFNRATSLRAFYYNETRDRHPGVWTYRFAVVMMCRQANWPPSTDPFRALQGVLLAERCDMSPDEIELAWQQMGQERGGVSNDALLAPISALIAARSASARRAAVAAILANGDPFTLQAMLLHESDPASPKQERVYFDGRWYGGPMGARNIDDAYKLASCELGLDCSERSTAALRACVIDGWCGTTVANGARLAIEHATPGRFAEVSALAKAMSTAMHEQRVDAFLPP